MTQFVTNIRAATRYDAAALARLGARSDRVRAHALLAEEAGEIIAAIDLTSGKVFADSARSTSEVVHALRQRRYELLRQRRHELLRQSRFALALRASSPLAARRRKRKLKTAAVLGVVIAVATAAVAAAFQALPSGAQMNDDPAAGIDRNVSVSGEDSTNADVVGGALVAGKPAVPWAVFRQQEASGADQVFSRSFANAVADPGRRQAQR